MKTHTQTHRGREGATVFTIINNDAIINLFLSRKYYSRIIVQKIIFICDNSIGCNLFIAVLSNQMANLNKLGFKVNIFICFN